MTHPILILSQDAVRLIRAGEVVSSPAAAIGELIANSLDAGSTCIDIHVSRDARDFSVSDNGHGIPAHELTLALQKHTTSKFIDTQSIGLDISYGFRGEALHALGTMCREMVLTSRISGDVAFKVSIQNGEIPQFSETFEDDIEPSKFHHPHGTMVAIQGLFETHKPRLENMRRPHVEINAIKTVVAAWSVVSSATITLKIENKSISYNGDLSQRAVVAQNGKWGITSLIDHTETIDGKTIHIKGALLPSATRYFSINGRPVSWNGFMDAALLSVSRNHGTGFIIDVDIPWDCVDVNIHPEKAEARTKIDIRNALMAALQTSAPGGSAGLSQTVREVREAVKKQASVEKTLDVHILDMIDEKYAVATHMGKLVLCDIHAAHERMLQNQSAHHIQSNDVHIPITLPDQDISLLQHISPTLEEEGWAFFIDSVGAFITKAPCSEEMAHSVLAHIIEHGESPLATVACHHAWKTGMERDDALFRDIISYALNTPGGLFCSHGRPVVATLDGKALEHIFERT